MTQFQVWPKDEDEARRVQRALFSLGYRWSFMEKEKQTCVIWRLPVGHAIIAGEDGEMLHVSIVAAARMNGYPIAKAEKIIAEAEKRAGWRWPSRVKREAPEVVENPESFVPFWMVMRDGGADPKRRHPTKEAADQEAERLAVQHPEIIFYVLEAVGAFRAPKPEAKAVPRGAPVF